MYHVYVHINLHNTCSKVGFCENQKEERQTGRDGCHALKLTNFYHDLTFVECCIYRWETDPLAVHSNRSTTNISEVNRNTIRKICYMPKIGKAQLVSIISFPKN